VDLTFHFSDGSSPHPVDMLYDEPLLNSWAQKLYKRWKHLGPIDFGRLALNGDGQTAIGNKIRNRP
jgi:hypothetical protein